MQTQLHLQYDGAMERQTRQREAVLASLAASGRAMSPPEICELARGEVPRLNLSTVYRQLRGLQESGEVLRVDLPGQPARFEVLRKQGRARASQHHHHFHCVVCTRVFPIHKCPGSMKDLAPRGFRVEHHHLTLHGRCADCAVSARSR